MTTPILNEIKKMKSKKHISFHTPGHKGLNTIINWGDYIPFADLTEVGDLDNLQAPKGIIKESQEYASRIFKARETFYSINGTTGGLYMGLGALTKPKDTVLIQRNSHKSIYNSCILNQLDMEFINPKLEDNLLTRVDPKEIEEKLKENKDIKVIVITSPNYYGIVSDIEEISRIVRKYNRYLLVDEAHGSHFIFSDKLPKSSLEYDVDIVVQSTHKTLPSFTQTSMVHIGSDRVNLDRVREYSNLYQTTSPSYLFMLSLELASKYMDEIGRHRLDDNITFIKKLMLDSKDIDGLNIYDRKDKDVSKILFSIDGYTGRELEEEFIKNGIYLEMSDPYYGLALSTVMNSREDFLSLFSRMKSIARQNKLEGKIKPIKNIDMEIKKGYPIYKAFYMAGEKIHIKDSINRVSKSFITPYPPGTPILLPGEIVTKEILEEILFQKWSGNDVLGLEGEGGKYIEVIV